MVVLSPGWVRWQDVSGEVRWGDLNVEQQRCGRNLLRGGTNRWEGYEGRRSRVPLRSGPVSG